MTPAQRTLDAAIRIALREHPGLDYLASAHAAWLAESGWAPSTRKPSRDELVASGWIPAQRPADDIAPTFIAAAGIGGAVAGALVGSAFVAGLGE